MGRINYEASMYNLMLITKKSHVYIKLLIYISDLKMDCSYSYNI